MVLQNSSFPDYHFQDTLMFSDGMYYKVWQKIGIDLKIDNSIGY